MFLLFFIPTAQLKLIELLNSLKGDYTNNE